MLFSAIQGVKLHSQLLSVLGAQEVVFWGGEGRARLLQNEEENDSEERMDGGNWKFRPKSLVPPALRYTLSSFVAPSVPGERSTLNPALRFILLPSATHRPIFCTETKPPEQQNPVHFILEVLSQAKPRPLVKKPLVHTCVDYFENMSTQKSPKHQALPLMRAAVISGVVVAVTVTQWLFYLPCNM